MFFLPPSFKFNPLAQPQRIVSLVPSQTELLVALGLESRLVGITKYCIHPANLKALRIGGTKNPDLEAIIKLNPDIVIGNKEENERRDIEKLQQFFPVYISEIESIEDSFKMIVELGSLLHVPEVAVELVNSLRTGLNDLTKVANLSVLYFIWRKPWMVAGSNTYITNVLTTWGLTNLAPFGSRYPVLSDEQIKTLNPALILLSSEPYPFNDGHLKELQNLLPETKILLVDGELFSWYGPRMGKMVPYLNTLNSLLPAHHRR